MYAQICIDSVVVVVFYVSMFLCAWMMLFFSGFFRGYWPHGAKGVKHWRMTECWIKGKTSPKEHLPHQWISNFWVCVSECVCARLYLNNAIEPIDGLWPVGRWNPLSKRAKKKIIAVVAGWLVFFYHMMILLCACAFTFVKCVASYNSFWLYSYV